MNVLDSSRFILTIFSRMLPPGAPPQLRRGFLATGLASVPLWAVTIAAIWVPWNLRLEGFIRVLAAVTVIIAAMCWAVSWLHDSQQRVLIRQAADLYRRIPPEDRPPLLVVSGR